MKIGFGLGIGDYTLRGGYTPSPEAAAWEANIIANGGSIDPAVLQAFDEQFFIPAVANGNILSEADRIHVWITNSNNIAARTSLEGNNYFASFVASPIFDDSGVKSDGVSAYVNLIYNPNTNGVKLTQDDASLGYIVTTPPFNATVRSMGCISNSSLRRLEVYELSGQSFVFVNCTNFTSNPNDTSIGDVLMAAKRSNNTDETAIINASEVTAADASVGVPNNSAFELTSNDNGVPFTDFDTSYHIASWHGSGSFDYTTFQTLIANLKIALAAL